MKRVFFALDLVKGLSPSNPVKESYALRYRKGILSNHFSSIKSKIALAFFWLPWVELAVKELPPQVKPLANSRPIKERLSWRKWQDYGYKDRADFALKIMQKFIP